MTQSVPRWIALSIAVAGLFASPASALPIKEFRKFSREEQSNYIMAAVSMLAYSHAANGDVPKGRCVQNWFFGKAGQPAPVGPDTLAVKIAAYESMDPEKYHVEGVILGATDKACDVSSGRMGSK